MGRGKKPAVPTTKQAMTQTRQTARTLHVGVAPELVVAKQANASLNPVRAMTMARPVPPATGSQDPDVREVRGQVDAADVQ